jgi:hypothetical protein
MKGKLIGWFVLSMLIFAVVAIFCCGTAFADDGTNDDGGGFNWVAFIAAIGVFAWAMYSPAVYAEWVDVWKDKKLGTWRKIGYSIRAIGSCAGPVFVAVWKQYGASIIALVVTLFRVKFGLPTAKKMAGKAFK